MFLVRERRKRRRVCQVVGKRYGGDRWHARALGWEGGDCK